MSIEKPTHIALYSNDKTSDLFSDEKALKDAFGNLGWKILQQNPNPIYQNPKNGSLAFSYPLPNCLVNPKKRKPMKKLVFDTSLAWGLIRWALEHSPSLNYGTKESPLFRMTEIYGTLPGNVRIHMPPHRRLSHLMKQNGEMIKVSVRIRRWDVVSVWKPINPQQHIPLSPASLLRNLKIDSILSDEAA